MSERPDIARRRVIATGLAGAFPLGTTRASAPPRSAGTEGKPFTILHLTDIHLRISESIWNVSYHCNGALSGSRWKPGDHGDGSYNRTPPGHELVRGWPDGRNECAYLPLPI